MKTRPASRVELKRQPGQIYLVADGCPHPRPDDAPFRACMVFAKLGVRNEAGEEGYARLAVCEYVAAAEPLDDVAGIKHDCLVSCTFDSGKTREHGTAFGIPTVRHADGDSDGGDHD